MKPRQRWSDQHRVSVQQTSGPTRVADAPDPSYAPPPLLGFTTGRCDIGRNVMHADVTTEADPLLWDGDQA